jgi:hypothetical protein
MVKLLLGVIGFAASKRTVSPRAVSANANNRSREVEKFVFMDGSKGLGRTVL